MAVSYYSARTDMQLHADLNWILTAPSLMQPGAGDTWQQLKTQIRQWLKQKPELTPLRQCLQQLRSQRLGLYYEALWYFLLSTYPDTRVLAHNLQVRHQGKTLGAFDFIFYCPLRQQPVHLETSVKFYLGVEPERWLGPNTSDRLDLKWKHLISHQIQLSKYPAAIARLNQLDIASLEYEIQLSGMLFYPTLTPDFPAPKQCIANHWRGRWLRHEQLDLLTAGYWQQLDLRDWLSTLVTASPQWQHPEQLIPQDFNDNLRPLQIALMEETAQAWQAQQRYFIVPNHWPAE